jgi:hypothetical protein
LKHFASPELWELLAGLPIEIQELAHKNYKLLKANPSHPSLRFKKVGPNWSVRVGLSYRALGIDVDEGILWGWIGSHADYDQIVG